MRKTHRILILMICTAGCAAYFARISDDFTEVNRMSGAIRTRVRYAFVLNFPWKVESTWVSESAQRQGLPTEDAWQYLASRSVRLLSVIHADGRKPVSWYVRTVYPEDLQLNTPDEIDLFTHAFVGATEPVQRQMLRLPAE